MKISECGGEEVDDDGDFAYDRKKDEQLDAKLDAPNSVVRGRGWDGKGGIPMMVTYNGVEDTLFSWCTALDIAASTLRTRLLKVERNEMSWDECMLDGPARRELGNKKRREKLAESAGRGLSTKNSNITKKKARAAAAEKAMKGFFYANQSR